MENFVIKGNICYCDKKRQLHTIKGYLVVENGISCGVYENLPEKYFDFTLFNHENHVILPGFIDLHTHAAQYDIRAVGGDLQLLEWLNTYTFPEEAQYSDMLYAEKIYGNFVKELRNGATTRAVVYGTTHVPATLLLAQMLEESGLVTEVGKVNMDRNCPDFLVEKDASTSASDTREFIEAMKKRAFTNTKPVVTPRFVPSCTHELLEELGKISREYNVSAQSHLSENLAEIEWVGRLCPDSDGYANEYERCGLFGGEVKTIMAHCVHCRDDELEKMKQNEVFVAHCPSSNVCLASGVAPAKKMLDMGLKIGLGTDVAGGESLCMLRQTSDAVNASKLRVAFLGEKESLLSVGDAFYMATVGGGEYFGKVGSFEKDYEADVIVIDDSELMTGKAHTLQNRLARILSLPEKCRIISKHVKGVRIL